MWDPDCRARKLTISKAAPDVLPVAGAKLPALRGRRLRGAAGLDLLPEHAGRLQYLVGDVLLGGPLLLAALLSRRRREAHRVPIADGDLGQVEAPPVTRPLGPVDRDRDDRGPALERQPAHAGARMVGDRPVTRAPALRVDHDHAAAPEDLEGGGHRLLVACAAADREGANVPQHRRQQAAEELGLRHEAHPSAQVQGHEEVVQRGEVVGCDDRRPGRGHLARVDRPDAVEDHAQRPQDQPGEIEDPVGAVGPRPEVIRSEVLGPSLV